MSLSDSTTIAADEDVPCSKCRTPHPLCCLEFYDRQKEHFDQLLQQKWACDQYGHTVCVPTKDGQHFKLSEEDVATWVMALCDGEATTCQPPRQILLSINGAIWNRTNGSMEVSAVSLAPSRRRRRQRSSGSTLASCSTASISSNPSSGVPGIGYLGGKTMKWVGKKALRLLETTVIMTRGNRHISCLKKWERQERPQVGIREIEKLFNMLSDALEMSMPDYPSQVNKLAYSIGREVQYCLHMCADIPRTKETAVWMAQIQLCLLPLLLAKVSRVDALAGDLAWDILSSLTRFPLALQGSNATSDVIYIVARELAYTPTCTFHHSWLGMDLARIIETTIRMRQLTCEELCVIRELAIRRQKHFDHDEDGRPWEVAVFAQCASQDPWLEEFVLGRYGLQSLLAALDSMSSESIPAREVDWEGIALTLRTLAFLSEHDWVARTVDPGIVVFLLGVFRRSTPEKWFCIRFWAMDTIRNLVSHRHSLIHTLVQLNAVATFAPLTSPLPSGRGIPSSRILEDYKKEASKRAEEVSKYIETWTEQTDQLQSIFCSVPQLEPVAIPGSF